jgi:hypothetical protein
VCLMKKQIIPMFALTEDQINSRQDSLVVESFIRIFLLQCISFIYIFIHCNIFGVILWYSDLELRASGLWFGVESHWFLIWTWEPLVPELDLRASGFWWVESLWSLILSWESLVSDLDLRASGFWFRVESLWFLI